MKVSYFSYAADCGGEYHVALTSGEKAPAREGVKAYGMEPWVWIIAFVESITVFTIGSEMLLTASAGIFFELAPPCTDSVR